MLLEDARWRGRVLTGPSRIHGTGLFAASTFAAGEVILVRNESRSVDAEHPLREDLGEHEWHCDWLGNGRQILLPYPERHVNHSCEPTTWTDFSTGAGRIIAMKPIVAGQELTCSYSVNLAGGEPWNCNCGSVRCLGRVPGDFFQLPLDRQRELMPYLATWFIEEHQEAYGRLKRAVRTGLKRKRETSWKSETR